MKRTFGNCLNIVLGVVACSMIGLTHAEAQLTLGEVTDAPALTWTTGGDASWFGQTTTKSDGVSAAQSGAIGDNRSTWLKTSIQGPCVLSFKWSIATSNDYLYFETSSTGSDTVSTDWTSITNLYSSQNNTWQSYEYTYPGNSTLYVRWRYYKDNYNYGSSGLDAGFVDAVKVTPITTVSLKEASGYSDAEWTTSPSTNPWIGQTNLSYDGASALMSPPVSSQQNQNESTAQTTVVGPALLSFRWKGTSSNNLPNCYVDYQAGNATAFSTLIQLAQNNPTTWKQESLQLPPGSNTVRFRVQQQYSSSTGLFLIDDVSVTSQETISLESALDSTELTWTTSTPGFFGVADPAKDGVDSAFSGITSNSQPCYVETTITGPRLVDFSWYNAAGGYNYGCSLQLKGASDPEFVSVANLYESNNAVTWKDDSLLVPPGTYSVRWSVATGSSNGMGFYLDNVQPSAQLLTTDLKTALDNTSLTWSNNNSGLLSWSGMEADGANNAYAAAAVAVSQYQSNTYTTVTPDLQTTIKGPCLVSFRWKVVKGAQASLPKLTLSVKKSNQADTSFSTALTAGAVTTWTTQTLQLPSGDNVLRWTVSPGDNYNGYSPGSGWLDKLVVTPLAELPIAEAVDQPSMFFNTGPADYHWYGQTLESNDGIDAVMSPLMSSSNGSNNSSWFETELEGPGLLNYQWKRSDSIALSLQLGRKQLIITDYLTQNYLNNSNSWVADSTFIPAGRFMVRWNIFRDGYSSNALGTGVVDQITYTKRDNVPLGEALNAPLMTWYTGPKNLEWFGQTMDKNDYVSAAMTTLMNAGEDAYIETAVTGPGILNYSVKIINSSSYNFLRLYVGTPNGNLIEWQQADSIESALSWTQKSYLVPEGFHYIAWQFERNSSYSYNNYDRVFAYIDQVSYSPDGMWQSAQPYGLGSLWTDWFGVFDAYAGGWIDHQEHGWLYADGNPDSSLWLYAPDMDWLWTNSTTYPYLFRFSDGTWIYYAKGSTSPRYIYNFNAGEWELH